MSVTVILEVTAKPECIDELVAWFTGNFKQTRVHEGCVDVHMNRSHEDPNHLALVMRWVERKNYEDYLQWRRVTGAVDKLTAMAASAPTIRYFDRLDA
ncbi:MAG: antibiotic biosynthesis monooxygenase [Proteobacteria bacterium]|nr:antibiotic biosynthesis monooxygenase [Pseudomonadota bacterium]